MIEVAALTAGKVVPSSRFRVRQQIAPLREHGIAVREYTPAINKYAAIPLWPAGVNPRLAPHLYPWQVLKIATRIPGLLGSWRSDATWVQRELLPGRLTVEPLLRAPVVFDVDDAIWLSSPAARSAAAAIAARSAVVIAGNSYLAEWFSQFSKMIRVVPTAIDTDRFFPNPNGCGVSGERFILGWTGTAATLRYLEAIDAPLGEFLRCHQNAELRVIADREPVFHSVPPARVRFVRWSPSVEAVAIRDIHVGLMPLPNDDWTRGKCSFKMLQYMACGVPVVVSPVGMNREILEAGEVGLAATVASEWYDAFDYLYRNRAKGAAMGQTGRAVVERRFSRQIIASQLAAVFGEFAR